MKRLISITLAILFIYCYGSEELKCQSPGKDNMMNIDGKSVIRINTASLKNSFYPDLNDKNNNLLNNEKNLINSIIHDPKITKYSKISLDDITSMNIEKLENRSSVGDIILQTVIFVGITASVVLLILSCPSVSF